MPLDQADVSAYLTFRLRAAGYRGPDLFSRRVIAYLTRASGGLTRRINLIADKALLGGICREHAQRHPEARQGGGTRQ